MWTQMLLVALLRAESGLDAQAWDIPSIEAKDQTPEVFLVPAKQRGECFHPGLVCLFSGGSSTSEGVELREFAPPLTVLARGTQVAATGALHKAAANQPWQVEMVANFRARSSAGPMIVAVLDGDNPEAIANHEAIVAWDLTMDPGNHLGMRFSLSPEQGFVSSHSYQVRVVQGQGKAEKILAEGEFRLE